MIDPELLAKLDEISAKADKAYHAAESARKYLFWTSAITVTFIVLPLDGHVFAVPSFITNYVNPLNAATGNTSSMMGTLNALGL